MSIGCGWTGRPLAGIVRFADVAVEGTVLKKRTYATPDDRDILTEYEIATAQIIFQRVVQTTSKPGPLSPTIFKTQGGTVVFNGYKVNFDVQSAGRRAQLNVGDRLIIFGRLDKSDGTWIFGPRDFFYVSENTVVNWLPELEDSPERLDPLIPLAEFVEKVRDLVR